MKFFKCTQCGISKMILHEGKLCLTCWEADPKKQDEAARIKRVVAKYEPPKKKDSYIFPPELHDLVTELKAEGIMRGITYKQIAKELGLPSTSLNNVISKKAGQPTCEIALERLPVWLEESKARRGE